MKVIILEDEKLAMNRLLRMLKDLRPDVEVLVELNSLQDAYEYFSKYSCDKTDVLFFDIQLGDGQSFELFDQFDLQGILVFTTAYDQYALKAIKVKALDYLLKPVKRKELEDLIVRIDEIIASLTGTGPESDEDRLELKPLRFLVKMGKSLKIINQEDIAYFYSDEKISIIVTWDAKKYPIDDSLNKLESIIEKELFFRLNRKILVHMKAIHDMQLYSKSRIKVSLQPSFEEDLIVSTEKATPFKRWLDGGKK